jgi:oxygen-independent coproporphyrinogen-3 oxidase
MAGIYLHIPFCKQACYYCNFHFSTSLTRKNDFVRALLAEIVLQKHYIGEEPVETIYFGGGTPSLLTEDELQMIMEGLQTNFNLDQAAEITLEVNPDDVNRLSGEMGKWRKAGINRLSIGIQSFYEEDLIWMNRAHTAGQALTSINMAREAGFDNISIDLIYGSPTLSDHHWEKNVEQALKLQIPHLSCYALTVEPRTALDKMIRQKKTAAVDPDTQARQFLLLMDWLSGAGYEHYEISNFALPGRRSRHNSSYWQGKPYLGLGPSAHSYNGVSRQWNAANNALYINTLLGTAATGTSGLPDTPDHTGIAGESDAAKPHIKNPLIEKEDLTPIQQLNEYIMISLRTMEGCDTGYISDKFGHAAGNELATRAEHYVQEGKLIWGNSAAGSGIPGIGQKLILTREGKLLADGIAADLFFE